jgi:hypothetical protein
MLIMTCNACGWEGAVNLEETGPHTKALCGKCGKYIKMVSKKELDKLISNEVPPMSKAFTITKCSVPRGCSACFTEDPNGWCIKEDVVLIETSSGSLYLCEHHRKVLIDILKQY